MTDICFETSQEISSRSIKGGVKKVAEGSEAKVAETYHELFNILEKYESIIIDLVDVILDWDSAHATSISTGVNDLEVMYYGSVASFVPTCQFECTSGNACWNMTGADNDDLI